MISLLPIWIKSSPPPTTSKSVFSGIRFAYFDGTAVRFFFSHDHSEQRGLSDAVGTDNTYDGIFWDLQIEIVNEESIVIAFGYTIELDHFISKSWSGRNNQLQTFFFFLGLLIAKGILGI